MSNIVHLLRNILHSNDMKTNFLTFCTFSVALFLFSSHSIWSKSPIRIRQKNGAYSLYVDGKKTYIKGIGGTNHVEIAALHSANAFRNWGGRPESIQRDADLAIQNGMFLMQGIDLPKDANAYLNEDFKQRKREEVQRLGELFGNNKGILLWGIGNEIQLNGANGKDVWTFVDELACILHRVDKRHLTSTVISHDPHALDSIACYAPHLDLIGINSYGSIGQVREMVEKSDYKGPYIITEWGPTGWWECAKTEWGAPIEQTSEEKRQIYEQRYTDYIQNSPRCLGSFCFLWGQKEERTPTWFSMFVENGAKVDGLPLNGEKTPMVEAMQRVWSGEEPSQTAPVVEQLSIDGKVARQSVKVNLDTPFIAHIPCIDRECYKLTYVWELLREATKTATGGAYEPRPERIGDCRTTQVPEIELSLNETGNYRLYVYVLDNTGYASTANIPFRVE